jgi:hypothetical protein
VCCVGHGCFTLEVARIAMTSVPNPNAAGMGTATTSETPTLGAGLARRTSPDLAETSDRRPLVGPVCGVGRPSHDACSSYHLSNDAQLQLR